MRARSPTTFPDGSPWPCSIPRCSRRECIEDLPRAATVVLDGNFVTDPLYGALVAALVPDARVLVSRNTTGTATGAALLASHTTRRRPAPLEVETPETSSLPGLSSYRVQWRARTHAMEHTT